MNINVDEKKYSRIENKKIVLEKKHWKFLDNYVDCGGVGKLFCGRCILGG